MTSIYRDILGADFERLHPKIQERFGFSSQDNIAIIGRGEMERVWRGPFWTVPFLWIGAWRRIMFPFRGTNVPFLIENYAYKDSLGRETVTWNRTFQLPNGNYRFDATMINSDKREGIVDYLGTHQHLAVDIDVSVAENGGMQLRSGAQRFYEGPIGFSFPMLFSGYADVCEWFDDQTDSFRIRVMISNPTWGPLFGYQGEFQAETLSLRPEDVPKSAKPVREERRE